MPSSPLPVPPGRRTLVLAAAGLAAFLTMLGNTVVAVALRDVQRDLGGGIVGLQGTVTAYTVGLAALLLTGGTLVDVLGRRRTLSAGLLMFAVGSAGCALAGNVPVLIGLRLVQGAGAALMLPASLGVLLSVCPPGPGRARAVGIWAAAGALALVAGPVVGGLLIAAYGWPAVFWVDLPLCALVAAALPVAPAVPVPAGRRLDVPGQLLAAATVGTGAYGVVLLGRNGRSAPAAGALALAVLAAALLAVVERRAPDPVLPRGLLRDRFAGGAAVAALVASLAVFVLLVFLSLFLQLVQGQEALPTALRLTPLPAALIVVAPPAARWAGRRGPRPPVLLGLVLAASGVAALAGSLTDDLGPARLGGLLLVVGAGLGLTTAPLVLASLSTLDEDRAGLAGALVSMARELGGVLAVAGIGALVVARLGADAVAQLQARGAPPDAAAAVVDVLLGGSTSPAAVLAAADGRISPFVLLQLTEVFRTSYLASTRTALAATSILLGLAACVTAATLRQPAALQQAG